MVVGELLHKNLQELNTMDIEEVGLWLAYIKLKNEREEKATAARRRRGRNR